MSYKNNVRVNTFLGREQVEVIDAYARMMQISRSELLRGLLSQALPHLRVMLSKLEGLEDLSPGERAARLIRFAEVSEKLDEGIAKGVSYL